MRNIDHIREILYKQWPVPHWEVDWDGTGYVVRWWDGPSRLSVENFLVERTGVTFWMVRYFTDQALIAIGHDLTPYPFVVKDGVCTSREFLVAEGWSFDRCVYAAATHRSF